MSAQVAATASTAVLMSCSTSLGGRPWPRGWSQTSRVVALMRAANCRWASGGIAWSPSATRNQDGSDFQAGTPITSSRALQGNGCWTAYMTLALTGSTSAAKWLRKSSSGSQAKPCWSMSRCARAGSRRSLAQQGADRLALVQPERGDVDQANDVGRVGAERGDDLAAVGVPGNDGRPVLAGQDLAQPGDVSGQRGLRELGCGDPVPVGLQVLDDGAPTGAIGPGAMNEDDVGQRSEVRAPFPVCARL